MDRAEAARRANTERLQEEMEATARRHAARRSPWRDWAEFGAVLVLLLIWTGLVQFLLWPDLEPRRPHGWIGVVAGIGIIAAQVILLIGRHRRRKKKRKLRAGGKTDVQTR